MQTGEYIGVSEIWIQVQKPNQQALWLYSAKRGSSRNSYALYEKEKAMETKIKSNFLSAITPFVKKACGEKTESIMQAAYARYHALCLENASETAAVQRHTRGRIYPGIAIFESMVAVGVSREAAARVLYDFYGDLGEKRMAGKIRTALKIPGLYRLIPKIFRFGIYKMFGPESGFTAKEYQTPKNEMHIDMLVCPYHETCKRYGCPEIVAAYCHSDDVCYGNMHPKVLWERTKTLGIGGDCCDFKITVVK